MRHQMCTCAVHAHEQVLLGDAEQRAHRFAGVVAQHAQLHRVAQAGGQCGDALQRARQPLALLGHFVGARQRARQRAARRRGRWCPDFGARCARAPGRRSCGAGSPPGSCAAPSGRRTMRGRSSPPRTRRAPGLRPSTGRAAGAARSARGRRGAAPGRPSSAVGWRQGYRWQPWREVRWRVVGGCAHCGGRSSRQAHRTSQPANIDVRTRCSGATVLAWTPPPWLHRSSSPKTRPTSAT